MSGPIWNPLTFPVNFVLFGGKETPGLADVSGADSPRKWDERIAPGMGGAFLIVMGRPLIHFSVKVRLYTDQDWQDWYQFIPALRKYPKRQGAALPGTPPPAAHAIDVWHPWLSDAGIASCVIADILQPVENTPGEWMHEIKCIEFRQPKPVIAPVKAAKTSPEILDPVDQEILTKRKRLESLNQELAR